MRQEHQLIALGLLLIGVGIALLMDRNLNGAGWYAAGAGLVTLAAGVWASIRGGNVPHPLAEEDLPKLPSPTPAAGGCPKCGGASSRSMTGAETTDFYGYDRLVLARPRICLACGAGFEVRPSRAGCYVMVAFTGLGALIGVALGVGGLFLASKSMRDPNLDALERVKHVVGGIGALGLGGWWVYRSWRTGRRYWEWVN